MMDPFLGLWVGGLIEWNKLRHVLGRGGSWEPGRPLRLLFAGYNGARNTGADVRVHEMLRQIRAVLGPERVDLGVLTQDPSLTRGYFGNARQVVLPDIFPPFLSRTVREYDGVVACEGSMFKSKFADALTYMMIGSLGMAAARNRIAVGYGAEAGKMNRLPRWMTRRYAKDALVIARSEESRDLLVELGVPTELGTDTAWTFEPHPPEYGAEQLRKAGWDGETPILALCPIDPFCWPVKASLVKAGARLFGGYRKSHYRSVYFHRSGRRVDEANAHYLGALAGATRAFRSETKVFPVLVAMERLDAGPCRVVAEQLGGAPVFSSADHDMFELVSIARRATWMVSSRYHGIVTTMPGGVASAGVTMDERIRNLMRQRGQEHLFAEVDDPELEERTLAMLRALRDEGPAIREGIGRTVVDHLHAMARMGRYLEEHVAARFPAFETRSGIHSWESYLPSLPNAVTGLLEAHA